MVEVAVEQGEEDTTTIIKEVDVLRGREVVQRHSGEHGAICFVVRRPG